MTEFQSTRPRGARPHSMRWPRRTPRRFNPRAHGGRDHTEVVGRDLGYGFQSTRPRGARPLARLLRRHQPAGFNPRAHGGRDPQRIRGSRHGARGFNPRAHGGRDHVRRCVPRAGWDGFNPRAHGGRDLAHAIDRVVRDPFQSTRPRGARPLQALRRIRHPVFQSTRPRGARLAVIDADEIVLTVSIHAPTGGATRQGHGHDPGYRFQSTRPRGARPRARLRDRQRVDVSIHAPTGGATYPPRALLRAKTEFQSTRPRGARPGSTVMDMCLGSGFNPRAHGGRDAAVRRVQVMLDVSIHAPTGGATFADNAFMQWVDAFQSTRPRGARLDGSELVALEWIVSIHAPTGGATPAASRAARISHGVSIHAPTGGATRYFRSVTQLVLGFNPRAHGGRDSPMYAGPLISATFQSTRPRGARQESARECDRGRDVSIHAPTGGATQSWHRLRAGRPGFNPRAHGGRDRNGVGWVGCL